MEEQQPLYQHESIRQQSFFPGLPLSALATSSVACHSHSANTKIGTPTDAWERACRYNSGAHTAQRSSGHVITETANSKTVVRAQCAADKGEIA